MNIVIATLNAKFIHTNLALRCLKAAAQPDFNPEIAEYTIKDPAFSIVSDIFLKKPQVVGFSCYIWNIEETLKVVHMLKKVSPETVIVLGGPEVSYDANYWLKENKEIDFIVMGEGEVSFKQLLHAIEGDIELKDVPGICYEKEDKFMLNPMGPKIDLREMPSPYRFTEDLADLSKRIVYVETSRGCPFSCQFCLSSIEVGVRYFNREKVKDDIRYLMDHGAKIIKFVDRTFNISRSYAMEMFQFLIDEHKPGVVFQFEITADIMRPEVIQFLNDNAPVGLFRFEIGVQSTNDLTNELVKRKQNFAKLTRTVSMVKEGGKIAQHLDLIAGLPEEDYASFKQTFNDVFEMRPEELQLGFLKLLRGTGLRIQAKEYGYVFVDQAPYEIFSNNVLSFDDMLRIKQAEDVLEKYWNAHRLDRTVEYLVTTTFETPFDFFQDFGSYWENKGWSRIGHQLEDLFKRLEEFLLFDGRAHMATVRSLMKLDYLSHQKFQPRKPWWEKEMAREEQSMIYKKIIENPLIAGQQFAQLSLHEREVHKQTSLVPFSLDLSALEYENTLQAKDGYLLTYYKPGQSPQFSFIQKEQIS
ncbi:MAG: B12-binding domain-containing radical SAM protein [Firmicutes bacterium]|nr:B12-binding domain-containing radical SAM protein [Bacillota bacterium]